MAQSFISYSQKDRPLAQNSYARRHMTLFDASRGKRSSVGGTVSKSQTVGWRPVHAQWSPDASSAPLYGAQLAFHNSAGSAAFEPSSPVASERSDLSAPAYAPAVQVLAPIELRPEAAPPKEPDAAIPPAALNSIPQTSEAPVIALAGAPSEAGAAPEAAVNPTQ